MKLGAERKKIAILGGLLVVALVLLYVNVFSGGGEPAVPLPAPRPNAPAGSAAPNTRTTAPRPASRNARSAEFRLSLKRGPDDPSDVSKIDPTLRLDLLAKLQTVTMTGGGRNLFEFGAAPPPPEVEAKKLEPKIIPQPLGPPPPPVKVDPPKPQAPPIPLKFYGYISTPRGAQRRGFFLEGDEIHVVAEGDTIQRRYKVIRIGLNSVEMEDLQFSQRQTLPLTEQPAGSAGGMS